MRVRPDYSLPCLVPSPSPWVCVPSSGHRAPSVFPREEAPSNGTVRVSRRRHLSFTTALHRFRPRTSLTPRTDWRVHAGGVQPVPNQASFQAILDSSPQFSNTSSPSYSATHQGVVVLQHDIYVESVNLAIGYTVPYSSSHTPPFKLQTVTECQPRSDGNGKLTLRDAYVETNSDLGNPAWIAVQSHANSSTAPLVTSVITSGGQTRTVTTRPSSTSAQSSAAAGAGGSVRGLVGGLAAVMVAALGAALLV
jgi:hypothetical protein